MRSGTTFAGGYRAGGLYCGIKKDQKKDLAIIASDRPAAAWALLTTNRVKGAPVLVTRAHLRSPLTRAIGNFFLGLNKPLMPTRLFTSEEEALAWLKTFVK